MSMTGNPAKRQGGPSPGIAGLGRRGLARRSSLRNALLAAGLAYLTGCTDIPERFGVSPGHPMESGHLSLQEGVLEFQPCGEGTGSAVEDASGQDVRRIIRELDSSGSRITALVLREGDRLLGVRYAGLEGPGCADLPPPGLLEARGNEPFWLLRIDREGGRVTSPEEPDGVPHREGRWFARSEGEWTYEAEAAEGAQPHRVQLRIREERCVDSMSGARYPFTVTLEWGKRRMNGCALEGREAIPR